MPPHTSAFLSRISSKRMRESVALALTTTSFSGRRSDDEGSTVDVSPAGKNGETHIYEVVNLFTNLTYMSTVQMFLRKILLRSYWTLCDQRFSSV